MFRLLFCSVSPLAPGYHCCRPRVLNISLRRRMSFSWGEMSPLLSSPRRKVTQPHVADWQHNRRKGEQMKGKSTNLLYLRLNLFAPHLNSYSYWILRIDSTESAKSRATGTESLHFNLLNSSKELAVGKNLTRPHSSYHFFPALIQSGYSSKPKEDETNWNRSRLVKSAWKRDGSGPFVRSCRPDTPFSLLLLMLLFNRNYL